MEQVFKTKWVPDWQYVGMGVAILVVIVVFFWLQEWTALGGLIVPLMLFYSQSKTIYTIKDKSRQAFGVCGSFEEGMSRPGGRRF